MRILLARHGETPWNAEGRYQGQIDIPLSPIGEAQAQALGAMTFDIIQREAEGIVTASDPQLAHFTRPTATLAQQLACMTRAVGLESALARTTLGVIGTVVEGRHASILPSHAQPFLNAGQPLDNPLTTILEQTVGCLARLADQFLLAATPVNQRGNGRRHAD